VLEDTDDGEQEARLHLILPSGERSPAINGRFPGCDPVIPRLDNCLWHATLPLAEALARLKGVARIDNDRIKAVKLMIDGSGARLESEDAEYGQADTTIPVLELDGDFSEPIGFNAPYLIDALKLYKADTVTISGRGRLNPLRLTIPGLDHIAMVVMPLRIEW
jgi:DNA polymerase III sliding clamp (beta) subunit (PCNA family)